MWEERRTIHLARGQFSSVFPSTPAIQSSVSDPDSFFTDPEFFLNPDPVPDPGKETTFRKAIQKNLGVPTSMVLIYLYI